MANPTGTIYLAANTLYTWTDGDIYQIPQTDSVEGAATGASFSGLGVENQPHQVLLNKIQLTHTRQVTDETNISVLQTFAALFTSSLGASGWIRFGVQDAAKGQVQAILQWGQIVFNALPSGGTALVTFPIAFPNVCYLVLPAILTPEPVDLPIVDLYGVSPSKTQFTLVTNADADDLPFTVYWIALGY